MTCRTSQAVMVSIALLVSLPSRAHVAGLDMAPLAQLEEQRRDLDRRTASITDRRSFDVHAEATEGTDAFPLYKLAPASRARFVESLRFNARGLTTFDYSDLVRELGAADIHRLLKPFGFQHLVAVLPDVRVNSQEDKNVLDTLHAARALRCGMGEHCNETDYPGYKCIQHATCEDSTQHICTSNC